MSRNTLILCALLGAGLTLLASRFAPTVYSTHADFVIGRLKLYGPTLNSRTTFPFENIVDALNTTSSGLARLSTQSLENEISKAPMLRITSSGSSRQRVEELMRKAITAIQVQQQSSFERLKKMEAQWSLLRSNCSKVKDQANFTFATSCFLLARPEYGVFQGAEYAEIEPSTLLTKDVLIQSSKPEARVLILVSLLLGFSLLALIASMQRLWWVREALA